MMYAIEKSENLMEDAAKQNFSNKDSNDNLVLNTRFGKIEVEPEKAIYFPKGLYGFAEDLHFALTDFPAIAGVENFMLLQCLNDETISLPVFSASYNNSFIDEKDMKDCLDTVEVSEDNFAMMFIASSTKLSDGSFELSINTKAPIVMDTGLKIAVQYIFTNNKYSIRQKLENN